MFSCIRFVSLFVIVSSSVALGEVPQPMSALPGRERVAPLIAPPQDSGITKPIETRSEPQVRKDLGSVIDGPILTLGLDDCDTLITPDNDCNQNGVADECEIDCNVNDVADACEIVTDPSLDCDSNGVLDACGLTSLGLLSHPTLQTEFSPLAMAVYKDQLIVVTQTEILIFRNQGTSWKYESQLTTLPGETFRFQLDLYGDEFAVKSSEGIALYRYVQSAWQREDTVNSIGLTITLGENLLVSRINGVISQGNALRRVDGKWNDEIENFGINDTPEKDYRRFGLNLAAHGDKIIAYVKVHTSNHIYSSLFTFEHIIQDWLGTPTDYWVPIESMTIDSPNGNRSFGLPLDINGDSMVAGASDEYNGQNQSRGAVYVYQYNDNNWFQQARLTATDVTNANGFGLGVAIDGPTMAVSASDGIRIYQFNGTSWVFTDKVNLGYLGAFSATDLFIYGDSSTCPNGESSCVFTYSIPPLDCDGSGTPDLCEIDAALVVDCEGNPMTFVCELDCNANGVSDACDLESGDSLDCQGNRVPDDCELVNNDCNENGIPDDCEGDCNGNGVPDPCEILAGDATDCNNTGLLDECETDVTQLALIRSVSELAAPSFQQIRWFAQSVDMSGNRIILGSPAEGRYDGSGVAYIYAFEDGQWIQEAIIAEPNPNPDGYTNFGVGVAIDGDVALAVSGSGGLYIFRYGDAGWSQDVPLIATNGLQYHAHRPASLHGERIFLANKQNVLVFDYDGTQWQQEASLLPQRCPSCHGDVCSISAHGDTVAIGYCFADAIDGSADKSGAVVTFENIGGTWERLDELVAPDIAADAAFGLPVVVHGTKLAVMAEFDGPSGAPEEEQGAVYLFDRVGKHWQFNTKITNIGSKSTSFTRHIRRIALENNNLLIGKPHGIFDGIRSGVVDLYQAQGGVWSYKKSFVGDEVTWNSYFGISIALDHGQAIINDGTNQNGTDTNTHAYIFDMPIIDCNGNNIPDDCDMASGTSADCNFNGIPDDCDIDTPFLDCNQNGQFDTCEMDADPNLDCDASMRLDECENVPYTVGAYTSTEDPQDSKFGAGLAQARDILVIGDAGTWLTHVYRKQNGEWLLEQEIGCESNTDECGRAAATDGHTIAVSGVSKGRITGFYGSSMVHLYRHDGASWNLDGTLVPSDRSNYDGESTSHDYYLGDDNISIEGDTVAVGLARKNGRDGAVYIHQRIAGQWQETQILHPDADDIGAEFGVSVRLSGDWLFVGAHHSNGYRGSVYIYKFDGSTWNMVNRLYSEFTDYDYIRFGESLSVDDSRLAVVSPDERSAVGGTGVIYLYCLDNGDWDQCDKISSQDDFIYLADGTHISLKGDYLVVGCPECNYRSGGFVYLFKHDGDSWVELPYYDGDSNSLNVYGLGTRAAIDDGTALLAAPYALGNNFYGRPSVMAIAFPFIDCNLNSSPDECDIESGLSMDCNANRKPDECDLDDDGDLIPNDCDQCLASDISSTIFINGCNSGVPNETIDIGCYMADALESCPRPQLGSDATLECVDAIANQWIKEGKLEAGHLWPLRKCAKRVSQQKPEREQVNRSMSKQVR